VEQVLRIGETIAREKTTRHLIAEFPHSVSNLPMMIGIELGMSGAINARSTKMEKWLTEVSSEPVLRE
jgi:hypothetical protein